MRITSLLFVYLCLSLLEQAEHAVEHYLLLTLVGFGQPCRVQCLAQETWMAIQIGLLT